MRFLSLALGGLLAAAALPARAQTTPAETPAAPRFYVGLGAYSSFYQSLGHASNAGTDYTFRLPVQLSAGYQLRPRLAVQVGVAYSSANLHYDQYQLTTTPGQPSSYYSIKGTTTQRQASVSALARYTLTANPAHRLQFDALGGFTVERGTYNYRGSQTNDFQGVPATNTYDFQSRQTTYLLTGGVGARYRLSRNFELTYDFTVNKSLNNNHGSYGNNLTNTLTTSQALGLRYRFGR